MWPSHQLETVIKQEMLLTASSAWVLHQRAQFTIFVSDAGQIPWWKLSLGERSIFCHQADKDSISQSFVGLDCVFRATIPPPTHTGSGFSSLPPLYFTGLFHSTYTTQLCIHVPHAYVHKVFIHVCMTMNRPLSSLGSLKALQPQTSDKSGLKVKELQTPLIKAAGSYLAA